MPLRQAIPHRTMQLTALLHALSMLLGPTGLHLHLQQRAGGQPGDLALRAATSLHVCPCARRGPDAGLRVVEFPQIRP